MREILFRGKRIDNGEWAFGSLLIGRTDTCIWNYTYVFAKDIDRSTVGQYTGLTDKNGKKIFEGDICNISIPRIDGGFNKHNKCLCSYEGGMYKFNSYSDIYLCMGNGYGYPDTCHQNIEVIGNIHDNPELLEVAEE